MKLGIIAALPLEVKCFTDADIKPDSHGMLSENSCVYYSGIGPKNATRAARSLIDSNMDALVSWGIAGALDPALVSGDILLPISVIDYIDSRQYPVNRHWHTILENRLKNTLAHKKNYSRQSIISTRDVQGDPPKKIKLHQATGAIAVDMESAAIAAVASKEKKPFIIIRTISDTTAMRLPKSATRATDFYGRTSLSQLSVGLLKNPAELFHYPVLIRSLARAKKSLREIVERCGPDLCIHEVL
uniref:Nucleoside phosphorylase n=1 Tax=Candidatus Kentrum sp. FW TaxID=2126338 RepID=A0A450SVW6_9GAMM|nr:MAG: Nucleoside phosphorylase [Candidatus Kentron sp. FW]VFJ58108.1 MAG: Nucleoside phosphorylase [Candidatus Kentron sp. FW]